MEEKIIEIFEKGKGFMPNSGFKITKLTEDICVMEANIKEEFLNPYDMVHGGMLFGISDACAGALACMSGKTPITTTSSINFLSPCKGNKMIAEATVLKLGNNIGYYNVNVYDENKVLVAQSNVNMYLKEYKK